MLAVWIVVVVLGCGAVLVARALRRGTGEVEPTVREFAAFREAISRQVAGLHEDTEATSAHLERGPVTPGDTR